MLSFLAAKALAVTINPNIPAMTPVDPSVGPGAFVTNFYQFALMIAGVLALGAIVYGGVKYASSAGNPSAQSDGKEWILSALYGLLLLAGAYIILYTINPNLVQLNLPILKPVNITAPPAAQTGTPCGSSFCTQNQICTQNAAQAFSCANSAGASTNPSPACKGVSQGCVLYFIKNPPPDNCVGVGSSWNSCTSAPPADKISCYNITTC